MFNLYLSLLFSHIHSDYAQQKLLTHVLWVDVSRFLHSISAVIAANYKASKSKRSHLTSYIRCHCLRKYMYNKTVVAGGVRGCGIIIGLVVPMVIVGGWGRCTACAFIKCPAARLNAGSELSVSTSCGFLQVVKLAARSARTPLSAERSSNVGDVEGCNSWGRKDSAWN